MAQKKLARFAAIKNFPNVFEYPENIQGKWKTIFKNDQPVILELACGRGEYSIGLAELFPQKNFIGVDIKGNRMYLGAKTCIENGIMNVAFLRTQIQMLADYFNPAEVEEIWLTFPDPHLRISKAKNRLTHPRFLRIYNHVLKPGGIIHLKTDSPVLFNFTKRVIALYNLILLEENDDVFAADPVKDELKIKTHYENLDIAQSNKIHYLKFRLPEVIINIDEQLQQITRDEEELN
ncbi:MAG: tRNA (guanosine(46)-N7)-methyltransferase TrmB [Ferruginibacter sp.]